MLINNDLENKGMKSVNLKICIGRRDQKRPNSLLLIRKSCQRKDTQTESKRIEMIFHINRKKEQQ